jgi:hypothetical protein
MSTDVPQLEHHTLLGEVDQVPDECPRWANLLSELVSAAFMAAIMIAAMTVLWTMATVILTWSDAA